TNTGTRAGTEVVQLYVGDPASTGEPVHQLKNFQRVTLDPGQAQTLTFTVSAHDLAYWNSSANAWTTPAGTYQILVADSSRSLPLTGSLTVASTLAAGAATLAVPNPHGMSSPVGKSVTWQVAPATSGVTYTATGLPAGLSISPSGLVSGTVTA